MKHIYITRDFLPYSLMAFILFQIRPLLENKFRLCLTSYYKEYQRDKYFVDIGGIVIHHYLSFLFHNDRHILRKFYISIYIYIQ